LLLPTEEEHVQEIARGNRKGNGRHRRREKIDFETAFLEGFLDNSLDELVVFDGPI
jgi:hypothetical protein